jgi:hypothetical protein
MSNAPRTLLQICNAVQQELGLPASTSVVGNSTDFAAIQLLALANMAGEEIRDYPDGGWTSMFAEMNIVVNAPITTTGNTTVNSPIITNIQPNTNGLLTPVTIYVMSGNGIPVAARVKSVDSSSQVTMTMNATGTSTAEAILFVQDTYALPSDFKYYQNRSVWDRTNHWEILGPDSSQMDQWHRSGIVALGPRRHFRQIGHTSNQYRIWPPPSEIVNPIQLAFEYISSDWVNVGNAGTTTAASWQGDTDTPYLDSRLFVMWLKWKFQQAKGLAYDVFRNDAIDYMELLAARDGGAATMHLSKRVHSMFLSPSQIVDGNFPGPQGPNMS